MGKLRNRVDVKLVSNQKDYLKWTSKPSYMSHKIFENDLVATCKNKVALTLNKPYIGMCILELSKVLCMNSIMITLKINMVTTKNSYSQTLMYEICESLMYGIKTEDVYEDFSSNKEMLDFSIYSTKSKFHNDSNKLIIGKMKDKTVRVAIEEFVGLKPKMYLYLVGDNSEHKRAKGVNRNVVATISHNEYKDILLNKKCLRNLMNRIHSKDHKIGTYEIKKISLSCFDDEIYIQNNGCDGLVLGYQS